MTKKFTFNKEDKKAIKDVVESLRPIPTFLYAVEDKEFVPIEDNEDIISQLSTPEYIREVVEFCVNISMFFVHKYGEEHKKDILEEISKIAKKTMDLD